MITNPENSILKPGPTPIKPGLKQQITNPSINPNHFSPPSLTKNPSHLQKPHLSSPPLMALSLSRPRHRSLTNPSLIHLFCSSSSSTSPSDDPSVSQYQPPQNTTPLDDPSVSQSQPSQNSTPLDDPSVSQSQPPEKKQPLFSLASYFNDVKASLKPQSPQNQPNFPPLRKPTYPTNITNQSVSKPTSNVASFDEIRKNLSEFKLRSSVPTPTDPNSAPSSKEKISFQELYKKNVLTKSTGGSGATQSSGPNSGINAKEPSSGSFSFDAIRESLRQMKSDNKNIMDRRGGGGEAMPFSSFRLKPGIENEPMNKSTIIGGTEGLPSAVFGKEMKREGSAKDDLSTDFVKMYTYSELGDKLRTLRPEVKKGEKGWFTFEELNGRLKKLRELEEKETESTIGGVSFKDLRKSLVTLTMADDDKKNSIQRLNVLGKLGAPNYTLEPPKEHLVEKYFHPDNMSSPVKMKIELAKVREEFKMSESDCGSARVQVALLTTKIKHLSSVLHKKDKHSRKGLLAMVQKRKKLLKYLRRTDWDSYCLVLSKLGLRDNPDHKNLTRQ